MAAWTRRGVLKAAGAVAFTNGKASLANAKVMRNVLAYAKDFGALIVHQLEEPSLAADGVMNEGEVSSRLGLRGIPAAAEDVMVARDIILAELTGAHLHVAHISTAGAVRLVREAKARGVRVTAEVTPHHLLLTDQAVKDSGF